MALCTLFEPVGNPARHKKSISREYTGTSEYNDACEAPTEPPVPMNTTMHVSHLLKRDRCKQHDRHRDATTTMAGKEKKDKKKKAGKKEKKHKKVHVAGTSYMDRSLGFELSDHLAWTLGEAGLQVNAKAEPLEYHSHCAGADAISFTLQAMGVPNSLLVASEIDPAAAAFHIWHHKAAHLIAGVQYVSNEQGPLHTWWEFV
jgi:hypothetical protein